MADIACEPARLRGSPTALDRASYSFLPAATPLPTPVCTRQFRECSETGDLLQCINRSAHWRGAGYLGPVSSAASAPKFNGYKQLRLPIARPRGAYDTALPI